MKKQIMNTISLKTFADYLKNHKIGVDELRTENDHAIAFRIENGDWKHDHLRTRHYINEMLSDHINDYIKTYEEQSDSDTFTAEYLVTTNIPVTD